jgi:UMF1 family MFS transporter
VNEPTRRQLWSWVCYDWANSAFATTVIAGFFPVFFRSYWSAGVEPTVTTFRLGIANGTASLILALMAPLLGAVADRWGARKQLLLGFAGLGMVMTGALYFVQVGAWVVAVAVFMMAYIGFAAANIFYDALLNHVADGGDLDRVSSLGFGLGYLGGGLLFAINVWMTLSPATFGLADQAEAVRLSFLIVAVWWGVFSIPLLLFLREPEGEVVAFGEAVRSGVRQLQGTFQQLRALRPVLVFLVAYFFYIDGVNTVIKMALDFGLALGFASQDLIAALLVVQFVGFPAALAFGWLGRRWGARTGVLIGLGGYIAATLWASQVDSVREFYAMAVIIGLVQGGVQALSRSFYARMIPPTQAGEFFGFYNLLGRFAAVLGPFLVAGTALLTEDPRLAMLSVLVLFVVGGGLLLRVPATAKPLAPIPV